MTPKDKAKELVYKLLFEKSESISQRGAKMFALFTVDEIITVLSGNHIFNEYNIMYWNEVKQEIQNL